MTIAKIYVPTLVTNAKKLYSHESKLADRVVYGCPCCLSVSDALGVLDGHSKVHLRKHSPSSASFSLYASLDQDSASLLLSSTLESSTTDVELLQETVIVVTGLHAQTEALVDTNHLPVRSYLYRFSWMVGVVDLMDKFKEFWGASIALNKISNINDDRILSLYKIFVFSPEFDKRITRYSG
ncbi:hypothetical protein BCV72DRAFT_309113 [Rhizopus microsporus var. microsporus]|uniref:Uncharacterized protein n=2 Tax=Rhizopus microsporus TaxID=58291 RepID=A0A2G4T2S9_RHIZD|nr:uncharacterized protein RHIMIDRAFT_234677 [Rhizopus microsporus ATCC 52813]ORE02447.1 hypothetical protein BCV72DRAFT_309113 [Rhizopus microsporus var. microsporus]PHZ15319.1 hypothetical protein RHIMIDRAFT_234677 [Rhizopus microsporus ATCC 52813]